MNNTEVQRSGHVKIVRITDLDPLATDDQLKAIGLAAAYETPQSVWGVRVERFPLTPDVVHVHISLD